MAYATELRQLIGLLNAPDVGVRHRALAQLVAMTGARFGQLVERLISSTEPAVRYAALFVLSTLSHDDFSLRGYCRLARDGEEGIRFQAISMMAAFPTIEAADELITLIGAAPDSATRTHCVQALRFLKSAASPVLGQAIHDRLMAARQQFAARAGQRNGGGGSRPSMPATVAVEAPRGVAAGATNSAKYGPTTASDEGRSGSALSPGGEVVDLGFFDGFDGPAAPALKRDGADGFKLQVDQGPALPRAAMANARSIFESTGTFRLPNELADFFDAIEASTTRPSDDDDGDDDEPFDGPATALPEDDVQRLMAKMAAQLRELSPRDRKRAEILIREGRLSTAAKLKVWAERQLMRQNAGGRRRGPSR